MSHPSWSWSKAKSTMFLDSFILTQTFFFVTGLTETNVTAIIDNPNQLRTKIAVWAISTNMTDLIETIPPFVDNFLKARIRPDAVTSNDVLNLAFNPRKAICEGDFASKIIVSENFTQPNIEVCKLEKKLSGKIFYSPIIYRSTAKETRLKSL